MHEIGPVGFAQIAGIVIRVITAVVVGLFKVRSITCKRDNAEKKPVAKALIVVVLVVR